MPEARGDRATYYQETVLPRIAQALEAHGGLTYELKEGGGAFDAGSYLEGLSGSVTGLAETDRDIHEYHTAEGAILDLLDPANVPEDPQGAGNLLPGDRHPPDRPSPGAHGGLSSISRTAGPSTRAPIWETCPAQ